MSDNDDLLDRLGELARAQHREHAELERFCRGDVGASVPGRPGALGRPPAESGSFGSAALAQATAPLTRAEQARLVAGVKEALASSAATERMNAAATRPEPDVAAHEALLRELPGGKARASNDVIGLFDRPARRLRVRPARVLGWLLPLVAAAALLLWLRAPAQGPAELPGYTFLALNAQAEQRSVPGAEHEPAPLAAAQPITLVQGATLAVELRPDTTVSGTLEVRVLLRQGELEAAWPAELERSAHGAFHLELSRSRTALRGPAELVVAVGRPGALNSRAWREPLGKPSGPGWQSFRRAITLP